MKNENNQMAIHILRYYGGHTQQTQQKIKWAIKSLKHKQKKNLTKECVDF